MEPCRWPAGHGRLRLIGVIPVRRGVTAGPPLAQDRYLIVAEEGAGLLIRSRVALLVGACLNCPFVSSAQDFDLDGLEAGLYVRRDDVSLENQAAGLDIRLDRLGIYLSERINAHMSMGLLVGIAAAEPAGQAVTSGMQLTGNYLGVNLAGAALRGDHWRLDYELGMSYQSVEDAVSDQSVEMDWLESIATVEASVDVSDSLSMRFGTYYRNIDIDQRARGTVAATSRFNERDATAAVIGVTLQTDPGGFVDLDLFRGAGDGLMLMFRRSY